MLSSRPDLRMDPLASALQFLKGVGPRRAADLQRVGLAHHRRPALPLSRSATKTAAPSRPSRRCARAWRRRSLGEVVSCGVRPTRRPRFKIFELLVRDRTGSLRAIWFNQPFLTDVFHPHQRVILFGKLELTSHGLQLQNPQYEVLRQDGDDEDAPSEPPRTRRCTPAASSRSTRRPAR